MRVALLGLIGLAGCGASGGPVATPDLTSATLELQAVTDTWLRATPRWRDIANAPYSAAFRSAFSYSKANVKLSYRRAPDAPYFGAHIVARGLKPNFAYQLKLAGKPISGPQGWGTATSYVAASSRDPNATPQNVNIIGSPVGGDDWSNQQLGYAGRWWDDTLAPSTNLDDAYFRANYPAHTIYGYLFLGDFVTDASGNANAEVGGQNSWHITWQDTQSGQKDAFFGTFPASQTTYGYEATSPSSPVKLWYERERGRAQPVKLAPGTYQCRLLVTEEAFHGEGGEDGGVWQTVLATEKVGDQNPANDIVFSIG